MSRRLIRISLTIVLLLSSKTWAIGLGEIRLQSALNEPLRAEIVLLSATPEELANLKITLATDDTFERYGIDRPFFLQGIQFNVIERGANDSIVQLRSAAPITEPFLTFLVEATWSRGRLLREYTVLLDPPTYAPPAAQQAPVVQAPSRSAPTDSARIERQPAPAQAAPAPAASSPRAAAPARQTEAKPLPANIDTPYDTSDGGEHNVQRGETLWGLASRMRPDSRLTINQTMMAIFEANPQAFNGNINRLKAGATIRVPSADAVFQISRGEAFSAVQQQNAAWGGTVRAPAPSAQPIAPAEPEPSLVLVPPDDEDLGLGYEDEIAEEPDADIVPTTRESEIEARIADLEAADVPYQQSLIEIRDNELASLRQELAEIRGEVYEPPADELADEPFVDEQGADTETTDEILAEEGMGEEPVAEEPAAEEQPKATPVARRQEQGIVAKILDFILGTWGIIIGVVVLVGGLLFWFMRRGSDEDEDSGPWEQLDEGDLPTGAMTATETMRAPSNDDESIVVVEQDSGIRAMDDDTIEAAAVELQGKTGTTGEFGSLEDTFSSETAVNLDQQDPLAEADFHMAYGLYDQAADLINGALEVEPQRQELLAKLCEIYFVWGNRDAFVDAAKRLQTVVGDDDPDWNKTVIMGQQIAGDDALFAGASAGSTKAVDLSFEDGSDQTGALDMDFGGVDADDDVDFMFGDEDADESDDSSAVDFDLDSTAATPALDLDIDAPDLDRTAETPTLEQQFDNIEGTSELPSLDEDALGQAIEDSGKSSDATAEINLDELDLGIDSLAETELASLDDLDDMEATGANPEIDPDATGVQQIADSDETGTVEALDIEDALAATLESTNEMRLAPDETGASPLLDLEDETDVGLDMDLLDATGHTQVLSEDLAVDTGINKALSDADATMLAPGFDDDDTVLGGDDDATMLAPGLSGDEDFDFAKTEALPADVFTGNNSLDETAEVPAVAGTDVDLDLDDLTAALKISQAGDTVDMPRDDATVEQPRPRMPDEGETLEMAPDDMDDDLNEARTMTEVGTKLDLARAYVDMGDPAGARSILEEVLDEGDESQRQQAQQLLDSLPS